VGAAGAKHSVGVGDVKRQKGSATLDRSGVRRYSKKKGLGICCLLSVEEAGRGQPGNTFLRRTRDGRAVCPLRGELGRKRGYKWHGSCRVVKTNGGGKLLRTF